MVGRARQRVHNVLKKTLILPVNLDPEDSVEDKRCFDILRNTTGRWTFGVTAYLEELQTLPNLSEKEAERFRDEIAEKTGLNKPYVQMCRDKALQILKSYRRRNGNNGLPKMQQKISVDVDQRCGRLVSDGDEAVLRLSTLRPRGVLEAPLIYHDFAKKVLADGWRAKSFKVVWKANRRLFEVHLAVEKDVEVEVWDCVGVDLGLQRPVVAYSLGEERVLVQLGRAALEPWLSRWLAVNNRYDKAQRLNITPLLKKLRRRRKNLTRALALHIARQLAPIFRGRIVAIGLPKNINQATRNKKTIHRWPYRLLAGTIAQKISEAGGVGLVMTEYWTTKTCSRCGARLTKKDGNTVYIRDRFFRCRRCGLDMDRDANAAKNIGYKARDWLKSRIPASGRPVGKPKATQ